MNNTNSFFFNASSINLLNKGDIITCGIDIGSVSSKAVICVDGELYCYSIIKTGSNSPLSGKKAFEIIESNTGIKISDCHYIVATGYGRVNVPLPTRLLLRFPATVKEQTILVDLILELFLILGDRIARLFELTDQVRL